MEFHLKKSFEDSHYIGLNEIQIFDVFGKNVLQNKKVDEFFIKAIPEGVFIDPRM